MKQAYAQNAWEQLSISLNEFRCYKDVDIEMFLRNKAVEFERRGYCTVYLILDAAAFQNGLISVQAYFTLSHKSIAISPQVSKTIRGKVATNRDAEMAHFVLIGQLGKYMEKGSDARIRVSDISAEEILDDAFEIIQEASERIVCRGVLVECSQEKKVQKVYMDYGFSYLQEDGHVQYYKRIANKTG